MTLERRTAICLGFLGLLTVAPLAKGASLPPGEWDDIDRAILAFATSHPQSHLYIAANMHDFDLFLALQGRIPSQQFLDSVDKGTGKLKPWNLADAAKADPKKNHIGSGHNVMRVVIGGIALKSPDTAEVDIDAKCGALCGGHDRVLLRKVAGKWAVNTIEGGAPE